MLKSQSKSKTILKTGQRAKYDLYPTPKKCVTELLKRVDFKGNIWEPACGKGDVSEVLLDNNYTVLSTDIVDHGYDKLTAQINFLNCISARNIPTNIVTNPPFNKAFEFVEHSINLVKPNQGKVAMFLRLAFAESKKRRNFFINNRPTYIYVFSERQTLWRNGEVIPKGRSGTTAYAWWVWDFSNKKQFNKTIFDWI